MHITAKGQYLGKLRTEIEHQLSGTKWQTDAPPDNNGLGESFSPTDMVAAALGSCMVTIMAIEARKHGADTESLTWEITKKMASGPRRISGIDIQLSWPLAPADPELIKVLKEKAINCPVALSLHPDLVQNVQFNF